MLVMDKKMNTWDGTERRRFPRIPFEVRVDYSPAGESERYILEHSSSVNVSPLGICIHTAAPMSPARELHIEMTFPAIGEKVFGAGNIVWCLPDAKMGGYRVGIEFYAVYKGRADHIGQKVAEILFSSYQETAA